MKVEITGTPAFASFIERAELYHRLRVAQERVAELEGLLSRAHEEALSFMGQPDSYEKFRALRVVELGRERALLERMQADEERAAGLADELAVCALAHGKTTADLRKAWADRDALAALCAELLDHPDFQYPTEEYRARLAALGEG